MEPRAPTVLVIEDHHDIREGFRIALEQHGYVVETAADGRDALIMLYRGLRPSIILMDLMMPVMNGFEFRQKQLGDADMAGIPLIAYSAVTDAARTASQLKANAYLHKPVEMAEVLVMVERYRTRLQQ